MDMAKATGWRERALATMPYGSSTCSKAPRYLPEEPAAVVRGAGCRVWDVRGREFIDFRNSLGPVTLGYCFPAVDAAVREQLDAGIIFGHPHVLECEVAELICAAIPCAEQARFLKTGGEAMAACFRLARAFTGRDHVVQIGYNGWVNTLAARGQTLPGQIGMAAPAGVPTALSALHHARGWADAAGLEEFFADHGRSIAAVAVAADYARMEEAAWFLPFLRDLTAAHGALLIMDEIVTGFRVAIGGVQEYFGVVPDAAVFAKGIANGMPLSVYCGARDVMAVCDRGGAVVISSTYGGEALSLAAAKACIETYRTRPVIEHLWRQGKRFQEGLEQSAAAHGVDVHLVGLPPCAQLVFGSGSGPGIEERFFRAAYRHGLSLYRVIYPSFSHTDADIEEAMERLDRALQEVAAGC